MGEGRSQESYGNRNYRECSGNNCSLISLPLSGQNPNFLNLSDLKAGTFYDENKVQVFQLKKQRNRVY